MPEQIKKYSNFHIFSQATRTSERKLQDSRCRAIAGIDRGLRGRHGYLFTTKAQPAPFDKLRAGSELVERGRLPLAGPFWRRSAIMIGIIRLFFLVAHPALFA